LYRDERHMSTWFLPTPPDDDILAPTRYADHGYATAMVSVSSWYSRQSPLGNTFDHLGELLHSLHATEGTYRDRNPELFKWIEDHSDNPFFLYWHSMYTHTPHLPHNTVPTWLEPDFPPGRDEQLRHFLGAPFDERDQQRLIDLYDGGVAYADRAVREIVELLDSLGVLDNTIIVISADHGEALGEDGLTTEHPGRDTYDELYRTPLIISGPGIPS